MTNETFLSIIPTHDLFSGKNGMPGYDAKNNPVALHGTIMRLFPEIADEAPRAKAGVLFRVEPASVSTRRPEMILIRSSMAPSVQMDALATRQISATPLDNGTAVAFRLSVNAVQRKTIQVAGKKRSTSVRPVPMDDEEEAAGTRFAQWLSNKLAGALEDVEILDHQRNLVGAQRNGKGEIIKSDTMTVQTDFVDGYAKVTDGAALEALMSHGVGRAKSYGCGLLTVKAL